MEFEWKLEFKLKLKLQKKISLSWSQRVKLTVHVGGDDGVELGFEVEVGVEPGTGVRLGVGNSLKGNYIRGKSIFETAQDVRLEARGWGTDQK